MRCQKEEEIASICNCREWGLSDEMNNKTHAKHEAVLLRPCVPPARDRRLLYGAKADGIGAGASSRLGCLARADSVQGAVRMAFGMRHAQSEKALMRNRPKLIGMVRRSGSACASSTAPGAAGRNWFRGQL